MKLKSILRLKIIYKMGVIRELQLLNQDGKEIGNWYGGDETTDATAILEFIEKLHNNGIEVDIGFVDDKTTYPQKLEYSTTKQKYI